MQQTKSHGNKDEFDQINALWRWLKQQPMPETTQGGNDPIWGQLVSSAKAALDAYDGEGLLLRRLLMVTLVYIRDEWKRRKYGT